MDSSEEEFKACDAGSTVGLGFSGVLKSNSHLIDLELSTISLSSKISPIISACGPPGIDVLLRLRVPERG